MIRRTFAKVSPRQSPSCLILASIDDDAALPGFGFTIEVPAFHAEIGECLLSMSQRFLVVARTGSSLRRTAREEPAHNVSLPHPQSRKHHDRKEYVAC